MHCRRAASCTKLAPRKRVTVEKRRTLRNLGRNQGRTRPRPARRLRLSAERAADRIPFRVRPMLATLVDEPFHRPGWVYEEKYDGYRILAYKEGSRVTLLSRNGLDRTSTFAEIAEAVGRLRDRTLLLDGEAVAFDRHRVSRFQLLQRGSAPPRLRRLRRPVPQRPRPAARAALREAGRARGRRAGSRRPPFFSRGGWPRTGSPRTGSPADVASRASSPRTPRRLMRSGEHSSGSR